MQNTDQTFKTDSFLEEETFKQVWEMAHYFC